MTWLLNEKDLAKLLCSMPIEELRILSENLGRLIKAKGIEMYREPKIIAPQASDEV